MEHVDEQGPYCQVYRRVNAIWRAGDVCYAAIERPGQREETAELTRAEYYALADRAGGDDYRDGTYIGFDRPIEWADVFKGDKNRDG